MNYSSGTQREAIRRRKKVSYCTTIFSLHLPSPTLPPFFFYLAQVLFLLLLAVPIECSDQRAGVGDYREGWVCSRTSSKYEPDCTGSSGMSWLVMLCSITCSTNPFTILFALLSHLLFFTDLFLYVEFSPTELSSQPVHVSACGCSSHLLTLSWGGWRVPPDRPRRSRQDFCLKWERASLLLCSAKRMNLQIAAFLFWTKLLIILQNIPKLCFISSKCQIPGMPESADDLCSQLPWYQSMIENNMLIKGNKNSYPDRIFPVKINGRLTF